MPAFSPKRKLPTSLTTRDTRILPAGPETLTAWHAQLRTPWADRDEYVWKIISDAAAFHDHIQSIWLSCGHFIGWIIHATYALRPSVNDLRLRSCASLTGDPTRKHIRIPLGRQERFVKNIYEVSQDRLGAV